MSNARKEALKTNNCLEYPLEAGLFVSGNAFPFNNKGANRLNVLSFSSLVLCGW